MNNSRGPEDYPHLKPKANYFQSVELGHVGSHDGENHTIHVPAGALDQHPKLIHHLQADGSVLALVVGNLKIYAGTRDGEIIVWSLETFELVKRVQAHTRSTLCLHLSADGKLLFSSAGDAIVNVWCSGSLRLLNHIYSIYDVGDVFSVAYSTQFERVYLGSQNTSIQWCSIKDSDTRAQPKLENHPDRRNHRFFDSVAAGGSSTPRPPSARSDIDESIYFEIDASHMLPYAHFGYVYCMLMVNGVSRILESNDDILISGGGDGTIKLWKLCLDPNKGLKEIACLGTDDAESVLSIAVDNSFLYSSKLEGVIELWDLDTLQKLRVIRTHDGDVTTLQIAWGNLFHATSTGYAGKYCIAMHNETYSTYSSHQKDNRLEDWKAHEGSIMTSAIIEYKSKKLYITGASDKTVSVWEITDCTSNSEKDNKTQVENEMINSLQEFVAFKTISSRTNHTEDCWRGATYLRKLFKKHGAMTKMLKADNNWNPVVYARFNGNPISSLSRKKILFYGHYDVVPADNMENKWIIDPFEMKGINGFLYGRGVSDNKGPIIAALYAVVDLIYQKELESDITFLIEGEEESGSRGFKDVVRRHKNFIGDIDYIIVANSYWINDDFPCLTYGLRGVLHATVIIESDRSDVHSGVDGSFMINEPLFDLTVTLAKLKGKQNKVMIPGFYDSILPLTPAEDARFDEIVETLVQCKPGMGPSDLLKASLMARWREPNLTIHRYQVSGPNGSLVSSNARADISLRLVPNQEVEDIIQSLTSYIKNVFAELNSQNNLTVRIENQADAWLGDPENTIYQTLEAAIIDAWGLNGGSDQSSVPGSYSRKMAGLLSSNETRDLNSTRPNYSAASCLSDHNSLGAKTLDASPLTDTSSEEKFISSDSDCSNRGKRKGRKPLYIREGGSIPSIRFLEKEFGAPAAHLPCGQASDSAHLENERFRVKNFHKSREIFRQVFRELPRR